MANVIMVNMQDGEGFLDFPLVEDIQPQLENTYSSIGDLLGGLSNLVGLYNTASVLTSGSMSGTGKTLNNIIAFPKWENTAPVKVAVKLLFYLGAERMETGKELNDTMNLFIKKASISRGKNGKGYAVPGLSASDIIKTSSNKDKEEKDTGVASSKLVDIIIPRVLQLKNAYIASITPTYSRQKTTSGYPIWGILDIQFSGLVMAIFEDNFENVPGQFEAFFSKIGGI